MRRKLLVVISAGTVVSIALLLLATSKASEDKHNELDELNPFGSVEDVALPVQLGQPPTLSHLLYTNFGPGYDKVGRPLSDKFGRQNSQSSVRLATKQPARELQQPIQVAQASASFVDLQGKARDDYWQCLNLFYQAKAMAQHADWIEQRSTWAAQSLAAAVSTAASATAGEGAARAARDRAAAEDERAAAAADLSRLGRDAAGERSAGRSALQRAAALYARAARVFGGAVLAEAEAAAAAARSGGGDAAAAGEAVESGAGDMWRATQAQWDFFYHTDRKLAAMQAGIDARRAQILAQVLPSRSAGSVAVSAYVPPWNPLSHCSTTSAAAASPQATVEGLTALCEAAAGLPAAAEPVAFERGAAGVAGAGGEAEMPAEGQEELEALDGEQARVNRARFLLYLREFGPSPALLRAVPQGEKATQKLSYYPGDFEMPRITDCDTPGKCHDWAGGQYIDNWAQVGTNWDTLGRAVSGTLRWAPAALAAPDAARLRPAPGGGAARLSQLVELPEPAAAAAGDDAAAATTVAAPGVDWSAFAAQERLEDQRAASAAAALTDPSLQALPAQQLLAQASPQLAARLSSLPAATPAAAPTTTLTYAGDAGDGFGGDAVDRAAAGRGRRGGGEDSAAREERAEAAREVRLDRRRRQLQKRLRAVGPRQNN